MAERETIMFLALQGDEEILKTWKFLGSCGSIGSKNASGPPAR